MNNENNFKNILKLKTGTVRINRTANLFISGCSVALVAFATTTMFINKSFHSDLMILNGLGFVSGISSARDAYISNKELKFSKKKNK